MDTLVSECWNRALVFPQSQAAPTHGRAMRQTHPSGCNEAREAVHRAIIVSGPPNAVCLVCDGVELRSRPSAAHLQHVPVAIERGALQLDDFGVGSREFGARGGDVDVAAVHGFFN